MSYYGGRGSGRRYYSDRVTVNGEPTEAVECEAFVRWLQIRNIPHCHIPLEAIGRSAPQMARLKRMGVVAGYPDYVVYAPDNTNGSFKPLAIEMKRKKGGKATEAQENWLDIMSRSGIEGRVCHGWEEAKAFVEEHL